MMSMRTTNLEPLGEPCDQVNLPRDQVNLESASALSIPMSLDAPVDAKVPTLSLDSIAGKDSAAAELTVGSVLRERYVIDSCVGRGGMGVVYRAIDKFRREHGEVDCHVAIKVLHPGNDARPEALARLRREFYCAQALSHQNVVNVFELDRDGALDFFTMEYLDGELLSEVLLQFAGRPLPRTAAWAIICQIGEGIAHAHERNVVHADLKPQNIMLTKAGQVRILDFGASSDSGRVSSSQRAPRSNPLALTPAYASCELLAGKRADPRDDLYALACLACELLGGQHPFWHQRSTEARMAQAVPTRPPHLTDRQWRTLQRGLAWDREHRSIRVREWLAALNPLPASISAIPRPPQTDSVRVPPPAKLSAMRVMAALGLFVACLCAWALFNRPARMPMTASAVAAPANGQTSPPGGSAIVESAAAVVAASVSPADAAPQEAPPVASTPRAMGAGPTLEKINFASASYSLPPGAKFAEVRVRRNTASPDKASFEWWTEDSSARSGIDFVTQPRAKVTFLPGSRTASLFVKVLDDSARKQAAKFDVVIGGASKGTLLGVSRAEVTLGSGR
jgi:serine/threonine protein kinase